VSGRGLPDALRSVIEDTLAALGAPARVERVAPLGGGCISHASRLETERGDRFFLKWNARAPAGMFGAEAEGLRTLVSPPGPRAEPGEARGPAGTLRVPEVIAVGEADRGVPAWLLLEYVGAGRPGHDYAERLGEGLAGLHRSAAEDPAGRSSARSNARWAKRWGWPRDGFIGPLPQENAPSSRWGEFWRDCRLAPQLALARERGHFTDGDRARLLDRVVERTGPLLAAVEEQPSSLLHGDLWGGNVYPDEAGAPVLIDPSVYRGHREVDLAMSELFGGFPGGWPDPYGRAWPIDAGYRTYRRGLYQLYYLLVHVNLFGASYEARCLRAAQEALRGG